VILVGIGTDIVDVGRFDRLLARRGSTFVDRWFSDAEVAECRRAPRCAEAFAARFAVKEAVWKSIGGADRNAPLPWRSISVRCAEGSWLVELVDPASQTARAAGAESFKCTVATMSGIAVAAAHAYG
jgi:phosphopantetheine--protein transferase-like protein